MRESRLLTVAAADRPGLVSALQRYRSLPLDALDAEMKQVHVGAGPERLAIVTRLETLHASLDAAIARLPGLTAARWVSRPHGVSYRAGHVPGRIAFLFPGQGSEHIGMLRDLRRHVPMVQAWFTAIEQAAVDLHLSPPSVLVDPPDTDAARAHAQRALHRMEQGAQLGSVAALAMHDVAQALGLRADAHVGHSNGEHPAVIAAGRVRATQEELCRGFLQLGVAGSRLPLPAREERLLTVAALPKGRLPQLLERWQGSIHLAMDNCPSQAVAGGAADDIERFAVEVAAANGIAAALPFERAYHTPLFRDWSDTLAAYYDNLPIGVGAVPVYSCHTVAPLPEDPAACRRTMAAQWMRLVRFTDTIRLLRQRGVGVFVEMGPDNKLTPFVEDTLRGQPHVAVSLNASGRDEGTQLRAALGELFVAGLPVDGRRLDALLGSTISAPPPLHAPPRPAQDASIAAVAAVHRRLITDAQQRLSRVAALVAPAVTRSSMPAPLIGTVIDRSPSRLRARHRFSRATHPFVDHHALGRPRAAHPGGGYPLPVIAFTMSLEIAAEAARALTGRPVHTITNARGSRWLALDNGALTLEIDARAGAGVTVHLRDRGATVPMPAFEATITSGPAFPVRVAEEPSAAQPRHWTPDAFYERYAFHGPAFQGISRITSVGPTTITADLRVTAIPGLATNELVFDPAVLDCAGQLVAFWLLEQQDRPPAFGVFPFRAQRVSIARPPLPAGSLVRARARIAERDGMTTADVSFETGDGAFVMGIEGLEQRILPFPDASARRLIPGEPHAVPGPEDEEFLASSWHIWERALAHLALSPAQLAAWLAHEGPARARTRWLIDTLAGGGPRNS